MTFILLLLLSLLNHQELPLKRESIQIRQGVILTKITLGTDESNIYMVYVPYKRLNEARSSLSRLRKYGDVKLSKLSGSNCVVVAELKNRESALNLKDNLKNKGYNAKVHYSGFDPENTNGPWEIRILELDPMEVELRVGIARGKIIGTETTGSICQRNQALAAINADFFKRNGDPYSAVKHKGIWYSEPDPKYESIGFYKQNGRQKVIMGKLRFEGSVLISGIRFQIAGINRERKKGESKKLLYYNSFYDNYVTVDDDEWGIIVSKGLIKNVINNRTKVTLDNYEILLKGVGKPPVEKSHIGFPLNVNLDAISIEGRQGVWENCSEIASGSHVILKSGQVFIPNRFQSGFINRRHPRTILAVKRDGKIMFVTIDGRKAGYSVGMTLKEIARMLKKIGAVEAFNFDGGGSTTLFVDGKAVNYTSDGHQRPIATAILVF